MSSLLCSGGATKYLNMAVRNLVLKESHFCNS